MEHIQRAHPLGVSLGQVVVHCYHVHAFACQGVEEYREGCHKGLSFSGGHLRNLSLVEDDTSDKLHVIVHHIPGYLVSSGHPVVAVYGLVPFYLHEVPVNAEVPVELGCGDLGELVLLETAGGALYNCKRLRKYLVELCLYCGVLFLDKLVGLACKLFLVFYGRCLYLLLDLGDALLERLLAVNQCLAESGAAGTQFVVGEFVYLFVLCKYLGQYWLDGFHVPVSLCTEYLAYCRC